MLTLLNILDSRKSRFTSPSLPPSQQQQNYYHLSSAPVSRSNSSSYNNNNLTKEYSTKRPESREDQYSTTTTTSESRKIGRFELTSDLRHSVVDSSKCKRESERKKGAKKL